MINYCVKDCQPKYLYNTKCYASCPQNIYTIEQEKKCIQDCTLNPYTLYYNKECVKSCPSRYVNNNQYCELYLQLSIAPDNPNVYSQIY